MKKIFTLLLVFLFAFTINVYAAGEFSFDITYDGDIIKDQEKSATVVLEGTEAPVHNKVRIKVDISGPGTPTIYAYDSNQTKIDIAEVGYWGPAEGFKVEGTFENETPIQATFPEAGDYTITLSLLDLENENEVLTTEEFEITVEDNVVDNDENNDTNEENITEIPKTGTSIGEYAIMCAVVFAICYVGYFIYKRKV